MLRRLKSSLPLALAAVTALVLAPASGTRLAAQPQPPAMQVVASGLDNPRGLAFGPNGLLYVVEAGRGGTSALCLPNPDGPGMRCYGATGAITQVSGIGIQQRVITGLPSLAGPTGAAATGPHDIEFGFGSAWVSVGLAADPAVRAPFDQAGIKLAYLYRILFNGQVIPLIDLGAHEAANNPDGGDPDTNPYGFKILANRGVFTDAGANALLQVSPNGAISTLATFPTQNVIGPGGGTIPMQAVPTSVAEGPDGNLYVGQLTGFPFPANGAAIFRVPANGGAPVMIADGFTNIVDIAVGPDGAAYVLELDSNSLLAPGTAGRLTKIGLFGGRTELVPGALDAPGGMTIGSDNAIYVTTHSTTAGNGQVVRIPQAGS